MPRPRRPASPFRYFNSPPEVIRLLVRMYVRFPLSLRNVENLLFERGMGICHETVRRWWNRVGPLVAADIRRQRVSCMRGFRQWRWHLDEMHVQLNGEMVYLWRAVLRFRQTKGLHKFASVHANLHNQLAAPPCGSAQNATSPTDRATNPAARQPLPSGRGL